MNEEQIAADVFAQLKHDVQLVTDQELYGVPDYWATPAETLTVKDGWMYGDCDDFAILARELLDEQGIKSRLVYALNWTGEEHLFAITEHGWVLDNVLSHVGRLQDLTYELIMQSGFIGDLVWHFIK